MSCWSPQTARTPWWAKNSSSVMLATRRSRSERCCRLAFPTPLLLLIIGGAAAVLLLGPPDDNLPLAWVAPTPLAIAADGVAGREVEGVRVRLIAAASRADTVLLLKYTGSASPPAPPSLSPPNEGCPPAPNASDRSRCSSCRACWIARQLEGRGTRRGGCSITARL